MSLHFFAIRVLEASGAREALNTTYGKPPC